MLEQGDRREILEELLQQRDPLYREIADLVVETDGRKVQSVADEIIEALSEEPACDPHRAYAWIYCR